MIRPEFVNRKVQLIAEDLGRLESFKGDSLEEITDDFMKRATVERLLERIITRAIDINEHLISESSTGTEDRITRLTYRDTFLFLSTPGVYPAEFADEIARSAGLRNILVHDYIDIDRSILHRSVGDCLRSYVRYVDYVREFLERSPKRQS